MTRKVWAPYAALALVCCLAGMLAWAVASAFPSPETEERRVGEDGATSVPRASADAQGGSSGSPGAADGSGAGAASDQRLAALGEAAASGGAYEIWTVDGGIEEAVAELLGLYRQEGATRLLAYGYLDLFGNVWGALVVKLGAWVDVVVAQADEDDSATTLKVTRLAPRESEAEGGKQ